MSTETSPPPTHLKVVANVRRKVDAHTNAHQHRAQRHRIEVQMPPGQVANDAHTNGANGQHGGDDAERILDENRAHNRHARQRQQGRLEKERRGN